MFKGLEQCDNCQNREGYKELQKLPFDENKGVEYCYLPICKVTEMAMKYVYPNCHYQKDD